MRFSSISHEDAVAHWASGVCSALECCERRQGDRTMQEVRFAIEQPVFWQPEWGIFWSVFTEVSASRVELGCRVRLKQTITWCAGKVSAGRIGTVCPYQGDLAQIVWDRQRRHHGSFVFAVALGELPDWLERL